MRPTGCPVAMGQALRKDFEVRPGEYPIPSRRVPAGTDYRIGAPGRRNCDELRDLWVFRLFWAWVRTGQDQVSGGTIMRPNKKTTAPSRGASDRHEAVPGFVPIPAAGSVEAMFHEISTGGERGLDRLSSSPRHGRYDDLWQLALADPTTGLVNQVLLLDRLTQALKRSRRHGGDVLVCHIDLTNFGEIYDELGYISADEVLAEVCRRLTTLLRSEDTIGRVGRSEIVAVMAIDGEVAIAVMAQRLTSALERPVLVVGHEVHVSSSLGVAVAEDGESAEHLMVRADGAADSGTSFTERYMHHHG